MCVGMSYNSLVKCVVVFEAFRTEFSDSDTKVFMVCVASLQLNWI